MSKVVIVESPAKAKTINKYLGSDFNVIASYGHIRDLPSKNGSVKPEERFSMVWEVEESSKRHINEIKKALKNATTLYLATDPDREGEAISWHIHEVLKEEKILNNINVQRIAFNEITKKAIQKALQSPRPIDQHLVDAYLARRALDYLVGFNVSPILWRKLPGAKSAGRVQSVALRLVVEREQEIEAFKEREYWSVLVDFQTSRKELFTARLTVLNGEKLQKFDLSDQGKAEQACKAIEERQFKVNTIQKRQTQRNPAAPFITSTLQQEASRKLGFSPGRTMQIAQKLYEGINVGGETVGLITYMRTDSPQLSQDALVSVRDYIGQFYGKDYLPDEARAYKTKSKNAQEAHEAIRPTNLSLTPESIRDYLDDTQFKLYDLIWKRTIASQMTNAIFDQMTIDILSNDKKVALSVTGSTLKFDGFLKVYREDVDEKTEADEEEGRILPLMNEGETVEKKEITPRQHFTQPPPRYSEASLIKKLEELGIGRPSTYASIMQVLKDRDYVILEKKQLVPEVRGRLVTAFLTHFFNRYVQYDFTANLEEQLDQISEGSHEWLKVMNDFWKSFKQTIDETQPLDVGQVIETVQKDLETFLFKGQEELKNCPECKTAHLSLKLSRYGAFLGCENYPDCNYKRAILMVEGAEGEDKAPQMAFSKEIGQDPEDGATISVKKGPYGPYLQWDGGASVVVEPVEEAPAKGTKKKAKKKSTPKPHRVSLPATMSIDDVTLEKALFLKTLPALMGKHPETQEPIYMGIGRFGPYVKYQDKFISIGRTYNFFSLSLDDALNIINARAARDAAKEGKGGAPARSGFKKSFANTESSSKTSTKKTASKKKTS